MAELLEVPLLKSGTYNGLTVGDLQAVAQDTMAALPFLLEAQYKGQYRGETNQRFNAENPPSFLNLQHDVIGQESVAALPPEKLKELTLGVQMEVDTRLYNGEEWVVGNFRNVSPDVAKMLAAGYPNRSVEILPGFQNPDTGAVYPIVLRSVAFLDAETQPAVPQAPGYSVKLAEDSDGVQVVRCGVPKQDNAEPEEDPTMEDNVETTVKLSQEEAQKLADVQAENGKLKEMLNEMAEAHTSLSDDIAKFKKAAQESATEAYCTKLENQYNLSPVAMEVIRNVLSPVDGMVKMSADSDAIPVADAYRESLETLVKLAVEKDALCIPAAPVGLPTGKQQPPENKKESVEVQRINAVLKFWKDEDGKEAMPYHKARDMAINSTEYSELFDPTTIEEGI